MFIIALALFVLLGCFIGLLAGMLGLGGGLIAVPVINWILMLDGFSTNLSMHMAIATSLSVIVFTSIIATVGHAIKKAVNWGALGKLALGLIIGALLGPFVARFIAGNALKYALATFEILVGAYYLFMSERKKAENPVLSPNFSTLFFSGIIVSFFATALGIGGGLFVIPLLLWLGFEIHKAVGTSAGCTFITALFGVVMQYVMSRNFTIEHSYGFIYIPGTIAIAASAIICTPFGVKIAHSLNGAVLRRIFAIVLICIGAIIFAT